MMDIEADTRVLANDYRTLLQQELIRRVQRNKSYSLRAFARDLDLSPGFLSALLSRRKGLSPTRTNQIASKLGWTELQTQVFILLVSLETAESDTEERLIKTEIERLRSLDLAPIVAEDISFEYFRIIGDWYHAAILELMSLEGAVHSEAWIAERLSMPEDLVRQALKRLLEVGLLRRDGERFVKTAPHINVPSVPSETVRSFHRSFLQAAVESVDLQQHPSRLLQTSLMPISPASLKRIEDRIEKFTTEMVSMTDTDPKEQLYCLSLAFFRVDRDPGHSAQ